MTLYTPKYHPEMSHLSHRALFLLVHFHQEVEKSFTFPLVSCLFKSPLLFFFFFSRTCVFLFKTTTVSPNWLAAPWLNPAPFASDLQVEMSLFGSILWWKVCNQGFAECELGSEAHTLWLQARMHMSVPDAWVSGMLLQHFPWNPKSLKVTVFCSWQARIGFVLTSSPKISGCIQIESAQWNSQEC